MRFFIVFSVVTLAFGLSANEAQSQEVKAAIPSRIKPNLRRGLRGKDMIGAHAAHKKKVNKASHGKSSAPFKALSKKSSAAKNSKAGKVNRRKRGAKVQAKDDEKSAIKQPKVSTSIDGEARFRKGKGYFNFDKAELIDVVKQISKLTKKNFIVPERIKSQKITIICEKPVSTADAYRAFLAALEINNLNLVPTGKFYKISKRKDSVRQPVPTMFEGDPIPEDDALITAVMEFEHVDVDSVKKVVQNLMSKNGTLQTLPPSMMILADSGANILRIKRILAKLDIEGSTNKIHIVDVQYAAASDIASTLKDLFASKGKKGRRALVTHRNSRQGGEDEGEAVQLLKSIADDRTNKLIMVCSQRSFERIKEIIMILDVPVEEGTQQVHVYPLRNAVAEEIARTISTLAQGSRAKRKKHGKKAKRTGAAELFEGQVKVTADKATNSLVIVATGRDYKRLVKVIDKLDIRRPQVYVEAVIMEVSLSKQVDLGLNIFTGYKAEVPGLGEGYGLGTNPGGQGLITSAGTSAVSSAISGSSDAVSATNLAAFLGFLSFRGPILPGSESVMPGGLPSFGAVLQAVQKDGDVDVLSTPHILTTDNEKAEILVGQNVPFAGSISGGSSAGGYGGYMPMVSVQRQDVALKFGITPHISDDGQVRLEIEQEISDLGEYIDVGFGQKQPVTTKKNLKTTVVVKDQQSIILGGLISSRKTKQETKIPILGDLPLVGWAFKTHGNNSRRTNLLLVLTPYVIESDEDFRRIYQRKLKEREEFIKYFYGDKDSFKAHIEYSKKIGAFSAMHKRIDHEMQRIENGGAGFGDEILIAHPSEATIDIAPLSGSQDSADDEAISAPIETPTSKMISHPARFSAPRPRIKKEN